jgi:large subunit ribosomal protein L22
MVAVKSVAKQVPVAPKKLRLILDEVRGKRLDEAMAILRFMKTPHARLVAKAIRSAAANAENNYEMNPRRLRVTQAYAGDGPRVRRLFPRARGRADIIYKRWSNVTIVVEEE